MTPRPLALSRVLFLMMVGGSLSGRPRTRTPVCTGVSKKTSGNLCHWDGIRNDDRSVPAGPFLRLINRRDARILCWHWLAELVYGGCQNKPRFEFYIMDSSKGKVHGSYPMLDPTTVESYIFGRCLASEDVYRRTGYLSFRDVLEKPPKELVAVSEPRNQS